MNLSPGFYLTEFIREADLRVNEKCVIEKRADR
jgi:hypothetical protein